MPKSWMHRLAWTLGAFTLVILGAIVGEAARWGFASESSPAATGTPVPDPQLEAMLLERERAYRALIEEANARLEQAYRQIQELSAQLSASSSSASAGAPEISAALSPARALWIAMNMAPGSALMKEPELVFFQGALAYEVVLDQGILYIDANTGQILYNGIPPVIQVVQAQPAVGKGGGAGKAVKEHGEKKKDEHEKERKKENEHERKEKEEHRDDD